MFYPQQQFTPNFFSSPYNAPQPTPFTQNNNAMPQQIIRVNGLEGAKAYQMTANSSALLLDEQQPIIWLKQTDGAGYPTITPYSITPYQAEQQVDIKSLEQRIARLEEIYNAKSNTTGTKRNERQAE